MLQFLEIKLLQEHFSCLHCNSATTVWQHEEMSLKISVLLVSMSYIIPKSVKMMNFTPWLGYVRGHSWSQDRKIIWVGFIKLHKSFKVRILFLAGGKNGNLIDKLQLARKKTNIGAVSCQWRGMPFRNWDWSRHTAKKGWHYSHNDKEMNFPTIWMKLEELFCFLIKFKALNWKRCHLHVNLSLIKDK